MKVDPAPLLTKLLPAPEGGEYEVEYGTGTAAVVPEVMFCCWQAFRKSAGSTGSSLMLGTLTEDAEEFSEELEAFELLFVVLAVL